ncbi:D-tyrosyl-tRNA deacylase-like protein, partial [Mytilinidion resinicola]
VIQRVKSASVTVDGALISSIGKGVLVLGAIAKDDTAKDVESMAGKVLKLKLWDDDEGGRWKRSVMDIGGEVLCVSQFTLLASTKKGNKPDFRQSAAGVKAKELYQAFFKKVQELHEPDKVKDGIFAAMMDVTLCNDGPVTIQIDTDPPKMESPSGLDKVDLDPDLVGNLTKIVKEFQIPAELLE